MRKDAHPMAVGIANGLFRVAVFGIAAFIVIIAAALSLADWFFNKG